MLVLDVFLVPDRASLLFFFPFLGENESRVFLPFVGGGDISTAPRIGDLEYLDLLLDPINPLDVPSYDGDLEKERLPRLLIGDTIRRLRGDGPGGGAQAGDAQRGRAAGRTQHNRMLDI